MELLECEQRIAAAAARRFFYGGVIERQGFTEQRRRRIGRQRLDVDQLAVHDVAQLAQARRRRGAHHHVFQPYRRHHHDPLIGFVGVDLEQTFDGCGAGVVNVVQPEQKRPAIGDFTQRVARDHAPGFQRIERETHAAGPDRRFRTHGPQPLTGAGHPGAPVLVVAPHLPALQQRALNQIALHALEIVVVQGCAEHAVERAADFAVAGSERHHRALFVHDLTQPLGDAALAATGGADQHHQPVRGADAVDHVVAHFTQRVAHVFTPDQGARADTEQPRRAFRCGRKIGIRPARARAPGGGRSFGRGGAQIHWQPIFRGLRLGTPLAPLRSRLRGELPAIPGAFGQEPGDERDRALWGVDHGLQRGRLLERVHPQQFLRLAREGRAAREQPIQDAAERIQIGRTAHVVHFVLDLFGGHVARGARARMGRKFHRLVAIEALIEGVLTQPGQAEVQHVNLRRLLVDGLDEHVGRL